MIKSNIKISIITLVKNDYSKFLKTLKSIKSQKVDFFTEWLIIDGSNQVDFQKNKYLIDKFFFKEKILIKHINSKALKINGIYPSMNHGKGISKGEFLIFLNSGDTFFNKNSLSIFFNKTLNAGINNSLIFCQAKIIVKKNFFWYFPGKRLTNIRRWLKYFEPNHQTMLISKNLAKKFNFQSNLNIVADGYWKRKILNNAKQVIYIKKPLIKFFLDGVSSTKPSKILLRELIKNKNISFFRKIIFLIKYLVPKQIFFLYHLLQKYKSILIDFLL